MPPIVTNGVAVCPSVCLSVCRDRDSCKKGLNQSRCHVV